MSEYGVTDKGFVLKRFDTTLEEVQDDVSRSLGFDVSQNPQSMLNSALIVPFCDKIARLWEVAQESYYAKYPATASGINLDNACQYGNVFRKPNMATEYIIHAKATDGTVIPKNSIISSITNPVVQLKCIKDTNITRLKCHAIAVKVISVSKGDYTIELNSTLYTYKANSTDTVATIIDGLKSLIGAVDGYTAESDSTGEILTITDSLGTRDNEVILSSNLTTEWVVGCVHYNTVDYGAIILPLNTITVITSNVTGLISVTNAITPTAGREQENDADLRNDYFAKSYATASSQSEAIASYILDEVLNTKAVRVYENVTDETDSYGRPPHSIEVIVDGGNETEIAQAIQKKKAGGIQTYGSISLDVQAEYGDVIKISFNRPEKVYVWVKVEVTQGGISIDTEYEKIIKNILLTQYSLTIGDSFLSQNYIQPIYNALPGIKYCNITVTTGQKSSAPDASKYVNGNVDVTQRQVIDLASERIEVSLKK